MNSTQCKVIDITDLYIDFMDRPVTLLSMDLYQHLFRDEFARDESVSPEEVERRIRGVVIHLTNRGGIYLARVSQGVVAWCVPNKDNKSWTLMFPSDFGSV